MMGYFEYPDIGIPSGPLVVSSIENGPVEIVGFPIHSMVNLSIAM